jgi:hypothetical protein
MGAQTGNLIGQNMRAKLKKYVEDWTVVGMDSIHNLYIFVCAYIPNSVASVSRRQVRQLMLTAA